MRDKSVKPSGDVNCDVLWFHYPANCFGTVSIDGEVFGIPLIWGIGFSNLLHGLPLDSSGDYTGTFWDLFSGYTVLGGIAFVLLFVFLGFVCMARLDPFGDDDSRPFGLR